MDDDYSDVIADKRLATIGKCLQAIFSRLDDLENECLRLSYNDDRIETELFIEMKAIGKTLGLHRIDLEH